MRSRLVLGASLVVLCLAPAVAIGAVAQKPTSELVPIASGEVFGKPAGISAYDSTLGLCIKERVEVQRALGASCGYTRVLPVGGRAIEIDGTDFSHIGGGPSFSEVEGMLRPDVASVAVYFHRSGERRSITAVSGQLSAAGASTLHTSQFGRFLAVVGGCIPTREFKAVALAADGTVLGSQRAYRTPGICHPIKPPPLPASPGPPA